jgi:hypothetical protein
MFNPNPDTTAGITIEPAQRVIRLLADVKNGDDIKNATNSKGVHIFPQRNGEPEKQFAAVAGALGYSFGSTIHALDPKTAKEVIDPSALPDSDAVADHTISWAKDSGKVSVTKGEERWTTKAYNIIAEFIGDYLEAIREGLVKLTRFAIRVIGDVVKVIFEINGKILKFVVKTVGVLVKR